MKLYSRNPFGWVVSFFLSLIKGCVHFFECTWIAKVFTSKVVIYFRLVVCCFVVNCGLAGKIILHRFNIFFHTYVRLSK